MENLTGKQFGQYQIVEPLGEGGMAAVYKAYQPSMDRFVAIKVLPAQLAESEEFQARFKREAKILAHLQHPHILPVFDFGEEEGHPYIVMMYVEGGTLAQLIQKQTLSLLEVFRHISQIGSALSYAHGRGLIHRDVKPSNVLIDASGNCLLTDFGLARAEVSDSKLTSSGSVVGTPAYMSPEQGMGKEIDHRSDIYSLGIILYEMLTRRVPFVAETPVAVVFKHVQEPLPPLSSFNVEVPPEVETTLGKALAKNPDERYQTAEEFIRALQKAIPGASSSASIVIANSAKESAATENLPPSQPPMTPPRSQPPVTPPRSQPAAQPARGRSNAQKADNKEHIVILAVLIALGLCCMAFAAASALFLYLQSGSRLLKTATPTPSVTPSDTASPMPIHTKKPTETLPPTSTPTATQEPTLTATPTETPTPSRTPVPTKPKGGEKDGGGSGGGGGGGGPIGGGG